MDFYDEIFSNTDSEKEDFQGFPNQDGGDSDREEENDEQPRFVWSRRESAVNVPSFLPTFG